METVTAASASMAPSPAMVAPPPEPQALRKASVMAASYLRAAWTRRSSLLSAAAMQPGSVKPPFAVEPTEADKEEAENDANDDGPSVTERLLAEFEQEEEKEEEKDTGAEAMCGSLETAEKRMASLDDVVMEKDSKEFQVQFDFTSSTEEAGASADGSSGPSKATLGHFIEVLVQPDEHGLGLNLARRELQMNEDSSMQRVLVIQSFRRLHPSDCGPAEATKKLQVGDILLAIDGEPASALQQLVHKMQQWQAGNSSAPNKYVLLRFARTDAAQEQVPISSKQARDVLPDVAAPDPRQHVTTAAMDQASAYLLQDLAMRNELLQQQLIAAQLTATERSIQLDQLQAFYAKNTVESILPSNLTALTKRMRPFSRFSSSGNTPSETPPPSGLGGLEVAVSPRTYKLQNDIELAVQSERKRLQTHFEQQLDQTRRKLQSQHTQELAQLRAALDKKAEMLQQGFTSALAQLELQLAAEPTMEKDERDPSRSCWSCTAEHLRQDLQRHREQNHDGDTTNQLQAECTICDLLSEIRDIVVNNIRKRSDNQRLHEIQQLVQAYRILQRDRMRKMAQMEHKALKIPVDPPLECKKALHTVTVVAHPLEP